MAAPQSFKIGMPKLLLFFRELEAENGTEKVREQREKIKERKKK